MTRSRSVLLWSVPIAAAVAAAAAVITAQPPRIPGYDRLCTRGHSCSFGQPWTDDVDGVEGGHNGCDARNDLLKSSMRDVQIKPGTHGCVVLAGTLIDPYSGEEILFSRAAAAQVQIDHVFPLAQAWNRGAATWSQERRTNFANDPLNLLATSAAINRAKSDKMPGQFTPASAAGRCLYSQRIDQVVTKYTLTLTWVERFALMGLRPGCPVAGR